MKSYSVKGECKSWRREFTWKTEAFRQIILHKFRQLNYSEKSPVRHTKKKNKEDTDNKRKGRANWQWKSEIKWKRSSQRHKKKIKCDWEYRDIETSSEFHFLKRNKEINATREKRIKRTKIQNMHQPVKKATHSCQKKEQEDLNEKKLLKILQI